MDMAEIDNIKQVFEDLLSREAQPSIKAASTPQL